MHSLTVVTTCFLRKFWWRVLRFVLFSTQTQHLSPYFYPQRSRYVRTVHSAFLFIILSSSWDRKNGFSFADCQKQASIRAWKPPLGLVGLMGGYPQISCLWSLAWCLQCRMTVIFSTYLVNSLIFLSFADLLCSPLLNGSMFQNWVRLKVLYNIFRIYCMYLF